MKGKIAFVLGAAVGYVLGSRAGRERYEQIKRGAQSVWNTEPVQRGVGVVRTAAQGRVDEFKAAAVRVGKGAVAALVRDDAKTPARSQPSTAGQNWPEATDTSEASPAAAAEHGDETPTSGGAA
ncbi:Protoporphyrinogen IX oxidase, aerobic, HemY [Leucobacter sp. 7(1)]|uniref:hypothetical protein n=1 Tax=Leucobacter sp. 7(1) TaxID=1255613 RepID=UPI00097F60A4|nr:hypothetical protein [Leucobacter sp. 7(1)]SJN08874.1 Protoporphyrinogen IX oxidase, aerobic, HemY [Leucobacter sp. 7(1)]